MILCFLKAEFCRGFFAYGFTEAADRSLLAFVGIVTNEIGFFSHDQVDPMSAWVAPETGLAQRQDVLLLVLPVQLSVTEDEAAGGNGVSALLVGLYILIIVLDT